MEVSSTTTTSWARRLRRSWRKRRAVARVEAEQPVQRRPAGQGPEAVPPFLVDRHGTGRLDGRPPRAVPPPSRRRGEGHQRRAAPGGRRLGLEQRQDAGHRGRLAGAGPAGDHRQPPQHGGGGRQPLVGIVRREQLVEAAAQEIRVDPGGRAVRALAQLGRHQALVRPQAVQVQGGALQVQRAVFPDDARSPPSARSTSPCCGPGQCAEVRRRVRVGVRRGVDGGQVHADVAQAGARAAKAAPRDTTSSSTPLSRAKRSATWTSDGREDAGLVEGAQRSRRCRGPAGRRRRRRVELGHVGSPRSKRSLSASTRRPVAATTTRRETRGSRPPPSPSPASRARTHAAHEQVEDAAQMRRRGRSRGAASAGSGAARRCRAGPAAGSGPLTISACNGIGPVVPRRQRLPRRAQPVGLVVGDDEAVARQAEDEVEAPGQVPAQGPVERGVAQVRGVAGPPDRRAGRCSSSRSARSPTCRLAVGVSPPTSGISKVSSSSRSPRPMSRSRTPSTIGPSGLSMAAHRPDDDLLGVAQVHVAPGQLGGQRLRHLGRQVGHVEFGVLEHAVDDACPPVRRPACRRAAAGRPVARRRAVVTPAERRHRPRPRPS